MANRVGYNPNEKVSGSIRFLDATLGGVLVGGASRFLVQPFDVLKIRYQLQTEPRLLAKYKSLRNMVTTIATEEGLTAFWRGHMTAQYLTVLYMGVQFGMNEILTKRLFEIFPSLKDSNTKTKTLALAKSSCGAPAAVCATIISYPFDVIRTRRIAQFSIQTLEISGSIHYTSTLGAFKSIWMKEGYKGFYRGMTPQMVSMAPYAGLTFGSYEFFTQTLFRTSWDSVIKTNEDGEKYLGLFGKCLCSAASGILSKTITYPLDTVRKRLQVQGFADGRIEMGKTPAYSGMTDCFKKVYKQEGIRGFFKGAIPGNIKAAVATILYFQPYELYKEWVAKHRNTRIQKI